MNTLAKFSGFLFVMFLALTAFGQQEAQFTQNMFTRMAVNPAYAGSSEAISVTGVLREQWVGFKDNNGEKVAPQTFFITIDAPVDVLGGGLGASIMNDRLGFEQNIGLRLSYAYRTNFGKGELAFGPQIGFLNKTIDFSKFSAVQSGGDPALSSGEEKTMLLDLGLGVFYQVKNEYWFGLSSSQLIQTGSAMGVDEKNFNLRRHYYLQGGYEYIFPDYPLYKLEPSLLIKSDGSSTQFDLSALVKYDNKFWGGLSYRFQDALAFMVGVQWRNFQIGYAYDLTTSRMSTGGSKGSHEVMLNYNFKIEMDKTPKSYRNTRFL
ncbi:MAG: type IX secretion system membrane protein PorP/SprF [Bacteroidales bacterium]|nr:type IX secretion system membrane protein PorP/SprF [Bacteroidales bacterium]